MLLMVHGVGCYVMYSNGVMQHIQMILMIHGVGYYVMYSNGVMQYLQMILMIHGVGYFVMYSNWSNAVLTNASNGLRCWLQCYV